MRYCTNSPDWKRIHALLVEAEYSIPQGVDLDSEGMGHVMIRKEGEEAMVH